MASSRKARSADASQARLEDIVARQLAEYALGGRTVTVGLSGGIDSVVLLDVLRIYWPAEAAVSLTTASGEKRPWPLALSACTHTWLPPSEVGV